MTIHMHSWLINEDHLIHYLSLLTYNGPGYQYVHLSSRACENRQSGRPLRALLQGGAVSFRSSVHVTIFFAHILGKQNSTLIQQV